jgi:hypothetical protein
MAHLFLPPSLTRFHPRRFAAGPAPRHAALEYDLVQALRPALVVDLGAGEASSFFTYCQSIAEHDVDGICYAIDGWEQTTDAHDASMVDAITSHGRTWYPGICYVVKMSPPDARRHFADGTIDLLRIDGTRPDVIAGVDVEAWFRRVSSGGVIAWHGAASEPALWSLIARRCRHFVFSEGRGGLGLARKDGSARGGELLQLLFEQDEGAGLEAFYKHVYEYLEFRRILEASIGKQ